MSWFDKCAKVPWQPSNKVFQYVWPVLYTIYGLLIYLQRNRRQTLYVLLFGLLLNLIWVPVYIWNTQIALLVLSAMIGTALYTWHLLYHDTRWQSFLFLPYIAWLFFAWSLNAYLSVKC
uniref:TspO/MBR family protein n=1 Tax=viral metagenome TaxID=1070528 RepID=A0A6C0DDH4_9ZZZZ